jgi:hypothetical protein
LAAASAKPWSPFMPEIATRRRPASSLGRLVALVSLVVGASLLCAIPALAEAVKVPGSRVSITVPAGFEVSRLFSGFLHPNARASIVIAELPAGRFDEIMAGMSDEALGKKAIKGITRGKLERGDDHHFMTGTQTARGMEVDKFILLIKDDKGIGLVTANVPKSAITDGDLTREAVLAALASATLTEEKAPIVKQFTLPDLGPFKEAGKIMGSAVLYTLDGMLAPKERGKTRSVLIISPSIDQMDISNIDLKAFSQRALDSLGGYEQMTPAAASDVTIDAMKGARQAATAIAADSKTPVTLDQMILVRREGGYFRLLAILRDDEAGTLTGDVERIFTGFKALDGKADK